MTDDRLVLPARIDRAGAIALHDTLLSRRHRPLKIDAGLMPGIGVLAAQVLVSAALQWRADAQRLRIVAPPACIADMIHLGFAIPELQEGYSA
jgi:anti-anti-sigma regulatory factor